MKTPYLASISAGQEVSFPRMRGSSLVKGGTTIGLSDQVLIDAGLDPATKSVFTNLARRGRGYGRSGCRSGHR